MTDASFCAQEGGKSQCGCLIILGNGIEEISTGNTVWWKSSRIKRVVHSTFAAEMLACLNGVDHSQLIRYMASEMFAMTIPMVVVSDCMSLCKSASTTVVPREKGLILVLSELRDYLESESHIHGGEALLHINTEGMLADLLTKRSKGPSHEKALRGVLTHNSFIRRKNTLRIRWGALKINN